MARKSLQDLSGIAKTIANSSPQPKDRATKTTAPALGALQGSLSAIRELDPSLIDDWGPKDRLDAYGLMPWVFTPAVPVPTPMACLTLYRKWR